MAVSRTIVWVGVAMAASAAGAATAGAAGRGKTTLPIIRAHHGSAFRPTLGDWEGTADGFPASFSLRYDTTLPQRPGRPQYGITNLVVLTPNACPPSESRYAESLTKGGYLFQLGTFGSLGLSRFGFGGGFTARRTSTLSATYTAPGCRGRLTWHMHPATRTPVRSGTWRVRFGGGETSTFRVRGGGRVATGLRLPAALTACNRLTGTVDLFISARGRATLSSSDLRVDVRFQRTRAQGKINAGGRGCAHGPIRFTATAS